MLRPRTVDRPLTLLALGALALTAWSAGGGDDKRDGSAQRIDDVDARAALWTEASRTNLERLGQSVEQAAARSDGCLSCHGGIEKAHRSSAVKLGCVDCHGGDPEASIAPGTSSTDPAYLAAKDRAHVQPLDPEAWSRDGVRSAANPVRSYTLLDRESLDFVRFINPGDLRVAPVACGGCHQEQVNAVLKSPMTTTAIFWAAAAYANGILPTKHAIVGESYAASGLPTTIRPLVPPSAEDRERRGALDALLPLPRWQIVPPGEYFRAFERGGLLNPAIFPEIGNPDPFDEAGRPDIRVSDRGRGTGQRVSPAVINLHKTRLNDPHLSFLGTNDHPGDFRSSGCSGCHLVYANDRDPVHSGPWARYGHTGETATGDPTIPRGESGHPIGHRMTRAIPSSQCMSCHMHQPNAFVNTYLGYTMWDYETDAGLLWPEEQRYPTAEERRASLDHNPEGAAARGLWTDLDFLERVSELNPEAEHTQFAAYHGHGWVFRAVYKRDREGNLLDADGEVVGFDDAERFAKAVHLRDIHLERGMHCVDCHFSQDVHGTGLLHGEYGDAIEIACEDCHGGVDEVTTLRTSNTAAPITAEGRGTDLRQGTTPFGQRRFAWTTEGLVQRSMVTEGLEWPVPQVAHSVDPGHPSFNEKAARAKTMRRDGTWGASAHQDGEEDCERAHSAAAMTCDSCHSSWITTCFGCHLPQEANQKSEVLRYEGETLRNYASYNPQVIRTDAYMLGRNGENQGQRWAPVRSSSALVLSSINPNRQRIYIQQPPISSPGFSSQAFNPHVPHTVRTAEAKECSDCHVSEADDNNAWMAQLLTLGTGTMNFVGRYAWVGLGDKGLEAIEVTEWEEPQAVIGSYLHRVAYPDFFAEHEDHDRKLDLAHHHKAKGTVQALQLRGEYLYAAMGKGGFGAFDVANVDNKDFSERIITGPFSPLGHDTFVATTDAVALALPTTMPMGFDREVPASNLERPIHPIYRYAVVLDRVEGLILVDVATLTDGEPRNNLLERARFERGDDDGARVWTAGGALVGCSSVTLAGARAYVGCDDALRVVDLDQPLAPRLVAELPELPGVRDLEVQFRYAFAVDADGLAVLDLTEPASPRVAARLPLDDARALYVGRTDAFVAAGGEGVVIVDIESPRAPRVDQVFNADGRLGDVHDIVLGSTNASLYAYVADGELGLAVLQLTSPERTPGYLGFSPRPAPELIAWYPADGAVALSRGLDRDRAVDETGHQVSIFNRIGAGPPTLDDMRRLYLRDGALYTVQDDAVRDDDTQAAAAPSTEPPPMRAASQPTPPLPPVPAPVTVHAGPGGPR
ncbi:MAG: hypothetical protein AAGC60_21925 [Acidobacteriota bacterium]